MGTPQSGTQHAAIELDDRGRIVITAPALAEQLMASGSDIPIDPPPHGTYTNYCPNLVAGCGVAVLK